MTSAVTDGKLQEWLDWIERSSTPEPWLSAASAAFPAVIRELQAMRAESSSKTKAIASLDEVVNLYARRAEIAERELQAVRRDLERLWHFAGCPFDHCQTCIDDAEFIKSLHERLGSPSAESVMTQRETR